MTQVRFSDISGRKEEERRVQEPDQIWHNDDDNLKKYLNRETKLEFANIATHFSVNVNTLSEPGPMPMAMLTESSTRQQQTQSWTLVVTLFAIVADIFAENLS